MYFEYCLQVLNIGILPLPEGIMFSCVDSDISMFLSTSFISFRNCSCGFSSCFSYTFVLLSCLSTSAMWRDCTIYEADNVFSFSGNTKYVCDHSKTLILSFSGNTKYVLTSGGTLIVTGVDVNTDTGIYQCKGSNKKGTESDTTTGRLETNVIRIPSASKMPE